MTNHSYDETRRCHAAGHSCGSSRARTCLALSGNQRSSVARTCLARRGARALLLFVAPQRRIGPPERNQHAIIMQSALLKDESDHLNAISMQSSCNQHAISAPQRRIGPPPRSILLRVSLQSACNQHAIGPPPRNILLRVSLAIGPSIDGARRWASRCRT